MPRRARVFVEGLTYHVYNRVGRGEAAHMRHAIDRLNTYLAPFNGTVPPDGATFLSSLRVPIAQEDTLQAFRLRQGGNCSRVSGAVKVAFRVADRGDYVLWRYTPWVQICTLGGGNLNFVNTLPSVRLTFSQAH
jgi:hypothetical protein